MRRAVAILAGLVGVLHAIAAARGQPSVELIDVPTERPPPAVALAEPAARLVRWAGGRDAVFPEGMLLEEFVRNPPPAWRLKADESAKLADGFHDVYARTAADPAFGTLPSAMPRTLSPDPTRRAHAIVYRPPASRRGRARSCSCTATAATCCSTRTSSPPRFRMTS
jgi:hypothetical protein